MTPPSTPAQGPADDQIRLLVERVRGGVWVILACLALFVVADVDVPREDLPRLYAVKLGLAALLLAMLPVLRRTRTWRGAVAAALVVINAAYAGIATGDVIAGHLATTPLLPAVCSMSAAALLPWGVRPQLLTAVFMGVGNLVTLGLSGSPLAELADPATAVTATLGVSVYVAWEFARYRSERRRAEHALAERVRLEALRAEVRLRATEKGDLQPKLQACAESVVRHLDAAFARIWTLDGARDVLELRASAGLYTHLDGAHARVRVGELKIGRIAEERRPHLTNQVLDDPCIGDREWARREGLVAFAGHPLLVDDRLLGVVAVFARRPLGETAFDALGSVAHALASAIARAQAEDALAASRARIEEEAAVTGALARVGHEMISSLDTPVVLERLCQLTAAVLGADTTTALLWRPAEDAYAPVAAHGVTDAEWEAGSRVRVSRATVSRRFGADEAADIPAAPARSRAGFVGHQLCMALRRGREVVGILNAHWRTRREASTPRERRIAEGIARVASMALENARLVEELAHASRLKSEFVSTMSHELRTPLNVILGYAEMARDPSLGVEREVCLARIEGAGRELLELIESTLEIGRLEAGRTDVRLEPIPLHTFWADLGRHCDKLPRRDAVVLAWTDGVPEVSLVTDPRKLTLVMRNLVGNALKFTERGEVRATVTLAADRIVFVVADTGVGIRPEDQSAIFEMFRQLDGSDSRRHGGAGLGLYIVRRFVQQLGGTIDLESAPDRGSVFTVTLPRRTAASSSHAA